MMLNLRKLRPCSRGFIIKIDAGYYGDNFQENPIQNVHNGDLYVYSDAGSYELVKIVNYEAITLIKEREKGDEIFEYLKSIRSPY